MLFEGILDIPTAKVTPSLCKGALDTWPSVDDPGHRAGAIVPLIRDALGGKPAWGGAYASQRFSFLHAGKAPKG